MFMYACLFPEVFSLPDVFAHTTFEHAGCTLGTWIFNDLVDISQRIDAAKCMGICVLTADSVGTSLVLGVV